jgi:hypothetical protein
MSLVCQFLGHRRSRSRATFDEKRQQWVSDCRRCATILARERDGRWIPVPRAPDKLTPIERPADGDATRRDESRRTSDQVEDRSTQLLERVS